MYHMKTVSVRDLRYDFKKVEKLLISGEEVKITKRRKVIALLTAEPAGKPPTPPLPDFLGRLKEIYGDQVFEVSGAELISADREGR
jgi:antitoxin (DNA-binding transcriptional repressor) of toxin-antitoxin stability system